MYKTTPGIKTQVQRRRPAPLHRRLPAADPGHRRIPRRPEGNHDAGKGLWITELGWSSEAAEPATTPSPKARRPGRRSSKAPSSLLERNQAKWKLQRVYWFSVDDQPGACNFCDGSGLFGEGFVPKKSWYAYVKFAGGTPVD